MNRHLIVIAENPQEGRHLVLVEVEPDVWLVEACGITGTELWKIGQEESDAYGLGDEIVMDLELEGSDT